MLERGNEMGEKYTKLQAIKSIIGRFDSVGGGGCKCESLVYEFHSFCPDCGQAIDWSKE